MKIREACNQDRSAIKAVVFSVLTEYGLNPDPDGTDSDLKDIETTYINSGGLFCVLENEGEILGTVALYAISPSTCELRKMYLDKRARGQGQGKKLLDYALSEAKRLGFNTVELETASVLKEAIEMYKRYGFKLIERDHLPTRCDQAFALKLGAGGVCSND
jgi:putative acetyltransferase